MKIGKGLEKINLRQIINYVSQNNGGTIFIPICRVCQEESQIPIMRQPSLELSSFYDNRHDKILHSGMKDVINNMIKTYILSNYKLAVILFKKLHDSPFLSNSLIENILFKIKTFNEYLQSINKTGKYKIHLIYFNQLMSFGLMNFSEYELLSTLIVNTRKVSITLIIKQINSMYEFIASH